MGFLDKINDATFSNISFIEETTKYLFRTSFKLTYAVFRRQHHSKQVFYAWLNLGDF